jgi:hypothetical protein
MIMIVSGKAIFTDLDGTLLDENQNLSAGNQKTLSELGEKGVFRVVVTGRSLFSASRVLKPDFPIDVLVTSSGAGIFRFPGKELLHSTTMNLDNVLHCIDLVDQIGLDFMVHDPLPNNHKFRWHRNLKINSDFDNRLKAFSGHHEPLTQDISNIRGATQLIVICPKDKNSRIHEILRNKLSNLTVIRTTSPLDQQSIWYEIFPKGTSKSDAAAWVCNHYGLDSKTCLAVGNDYNDLDLLLWSNFSRIVANAPLCLRRQFAMVSDYREDGFSEAVSEWWQFVKTNP